MTSAILAASVSGLSPAQATGPSAVSHASGNVLGPRVTVFDPSMPTAQIEQTINDVWAQQYTNEMGSERYSFLFRPGSYGTADDPLQIKVGYYTEVAGLGADPSDVQITGKIESYNRCYNPDGSDAPAPGADTHCIALNNFWRTVSNLTVNVNGTGQDGCYASANIWAVSQAVSLRRVDVRGGNLSLMDYCSAPSFASGGYLADSRADTIVNGSQQQWFARNSQVGEWTNAVWNQVFSGGAGAPDDSGYPDPPYTTLQTTPLSREKPYLFVDPEGRYQVRVPAVQVDSSGISWASGETAGRTVPLCDFFIASPTTTVQAMNRALARGKNLLLTPGVYDIARSIEVKRADTVVLGLGHATLTAVNGATPLTVADRPGIVIAGVTLDAGSRLSRSLLAVGKPHGHHGADSDPANPITLSDVYFRVGGPHIGRTRIALEVNSDNVLIDHTWVWRADHGVEDFTAGVRGDTDRWNTNIGLLGAVINGDNVTATGLFVEHFQRYNTLWNGEHGRVVLYQCELAYDPPTQADWTRPDGSLGWPGYKVADDVQHHELWGGGVYVFNQNNPSIVTENGYEVPETPGVVLTHIMTKNLSGPGTLLHVVNGVGAAVDGVADPGDPDNYEDPSYVVSYP